MYQALWIPLLISQQWSVVAAGFMKSVQSSKQAPTDWSHGEASWREAMDAHDVENHLWSEPNYCDARVLHSSASLTVLFGLSTFWEEIRKYRVLLGAWPSKPLEIHIPGAAYPFEGRSDWSLLASRRPADIPAVRIVLVLGSPWHEDNVPLMKKAAEYDEDAGTERKRSIEVEEELEDFLQISGTKTMRPEIGSASKWGEIKCNSKGTIAQDDRSFSKANLCRNYGNGLEVVCVEKYYQEVAADLPKPDLVVMFSPGFPQLARRSWDQVLRTLLDSQVPIMVNDLLEEREDGKGLPNIYDASATLPAPGGEWKVTTSFSEGGMTLSAMNAYEAYEVGGWRNPFPIYISTRRGDYAKSMIVQLFRGRAANAKPWEIPSPTAVLSAKQYVENADWLDALGDDDLPFAAEVKMSLLIPCSTAYNKAMWMLYRDNVKKRFREQVHRGKVKKSWKPMLEKLGLMGKSRETPWTVTEWVFIITKLRFDWF